MVKDETNQEVENDHIIEDMFKGPSNERQQRVVDAFLHSWNGYKEFAWGHDNLKPISMSFQDPFGSLGVTILGNLNKFFKH